MAPADEPLPDDATQDHPDALGLWGFALASLFGNVTATGLLPEGALFTMSLVMIGGFVQLAAGRREHELGHTFGATSFTAFGFFWITLESSALLAQTGILPATTPASTGLYLVVWGLFAILLQAGASSLTTALRITVFLSWVGLLARGIAAFAGSTALDRVGAWFLVVCALTAAYTAAGQFLLALHGRIVLPLGSARKPRPRRPATLVELPVTRAS